MNTKKITVLLCMAIFACTALTAQDFKYIGASKCKMCHNKPNKGEQFKVWSAGPHAKAMESLNAEEAKDPKCLKCHSTVGHIDAGLVAGIKVEEGVSCESCHGPGSAYKGASVMKNQELSLTKGLILPEEKVCIMCHNEESPDFKGFDYAEYTAKIAHPDPTLAQ